MKMMMTMMISRPSFIFEWNFLSPIILLFLVLIQLSRIGVKDLFSILVNLYNKKIRGITGGEKEDEERGEEGSAAQLSL